jgi:hypothetical protein
MRFRFKESLFKLFDFIPFELDSFLVFNFNILFIPLQLIYFWITDIVQLLNWFVVI